MNLFESTKTFRKRVERRNFDSNERSICRIKYKENSKDRVQDRVM